MKYLKKFRLFENLESEIDLVELEHILVDFEQMGLVFDIKVGSSSVIDWRLFNDNKHGGPKVLHSKDIDKYRKSTTNNSLTIEINTTDNTKHTYNITDVEEGYEMLKNYLFDNYGLIPNYIFITINWNYMYFEDFDKIKELRVTDNWQFAYEKLPVRPENTFKAQKLTFGFYK